MMAALDEHSDTVTRLAGETVACSPDSWTEGTLFIQCDGMRLTYQLKNENSSDRATISEQLRDLIDELYVRMDADGHTWMAGKLAWARDGNDVQFNLSFEYS